MGRPPAARTLLAALAILMLGAPAAEAACGGVQRFRATVDKAPGPAPLAIGDSVMLGAGPQLAAAGFDVDVRGCRQMSEGLSVLRSYAGAGRLPGVVVVALGANWTISTGEIRAALQTLGPERTLALVTPREAGNRAGSDALTIRAAGERWPGRVRVLDWVAYSVGHPEWFAGDGLHLGPGGAQALAQLCSQAFGFVERLGERWEADPQPETADQLAPGTPV
jgi:hypothetical protein